MYSCDLSLNLFQQQNDKNKDPYSSDCYLSYCQVKCQRSSHFPLEIDVFLALVYYIYSFQNFKFFFYFALESKQTKMKFIKGKPKTSKFQHFTFYQSILFQQIIVSCFHYYCFHHQNIQFFHSQIVFLKFINLFHVFVLL